MEYLLGLIVLGLCGIGYELRRISTALEALHSASQRQ
jgi:hypothetical protein